MVLESFKGEEMEVAEAELLRTEAQTSRDTPCKSGHQCCIKAEEIL